VLVDEVQEVVLGRVLHLAVVLGLACGDEFLGEEVVQVDFDAAGHALLTHGRTTIPEEVEILHARYGLQVLHKLLTNEVTLLGVSHDCHGLVQTGGIGRVAALELSAQHL
jgi:hypothetical protein